jgi:hypothetical protein
LNGNGRIKPSSRKTENREKSDEIAILTNGTASSSEIFQVSTGRGMMRQFMDRRQLIREFHEFFAINGGRRCAVLQN